MRQKSVYETRVYSGINMLGADVDPDMKPFRQ